MNRIKLAVIVLFAICLSSCAVKRTKADLVLLDADIRTMDATLPQAEAVAIKGGEIVAVGTDDAVSARFDGAVTIDLHKAFVVPGLIDGHAHMLALGMSLKTVDLSAARSPEDIAGLVEEAAARTRFGGWIRGSGWDVKYWHTSPEDVGAMLDNAAPDNYVFLLSADGSMAWVNRRVLDLAGITSTTKSPADGRIVLDRQGKPTGVLIGSAINLVTRSMPPPSETEIEDAILLAADTCARYGLTEVQDVGIDSKTLDAYKLLADQGKLRVRVYAMYDGNDTTLPEVLKKGPIFGHEDYFTMRSIRVDMDGPLSNRQAALVREYSDAPGEYGATQLGVNDLANLTIASLSSGFQVCTEAHGDRACNVVLNAYAKALKAVGDADERLRVEGVDVLLPGDVPRFGEMEIIPSMQAAEFSSDMSWLESRLGTNRIKNAFAWRSLMNSGAIIAGGSDFPNNNPDPRLGIYVSVERRDLYGLPRSFPDALKYFQLTPDAAKDSSEFEGGFIPRERMTLDEALKSFTIWPAYAAFQDRVKGTIAVNKYADFTIFKNDFAEIPASQIPDDPVVATIVGGQLVYVSKASTQLSVK